MRDVIGNSYGIVHPEDPILGTWELFISLLLGTTLLTMPLSMAFQGVGEATQGFDLFIDICFLMDVVKNFNSGEFRSRIIFVSHLCWSVVMLASSDRFRQRR